MVDDDDPSPSWASDEKEEVMMKTVLDDDVDVDGVAAAVGVVGCVGFVVGCVGFVGKKNAIVYYSDLDDDYYYYDCYNCSYYYHNSSHYCSYWDFSMMMKAGPN